MTSKRGVLKIQKRCSTRSVPLQFGRQVSRRQICHLVHGQLLVGYWASSRRIHVFSSWYLFHGPVLQMLMHARSLRRLFQASLESQHTDDRIPNEEWLCMFKFLVHIFGCMAVYGPMFRLLGSGLRIHGSRFLFYLGLGAWASRICVLGSGFWVLGRLRKVRV